MAHASRRDHNAPWSSLTKISSGDAPQAERETVIGDWLPHEAPMRQNLIRMIHPLGGNAAP
jgi:hypothetical protein